LLVPVLLLVLFIVIPLAELFVIIKVGEAIGVLPTLAILIADSILGVVLLRSQGRNAWQRFLLAMEESRMPHREVFDGAMVILGGALLLTPGFITDIFGIILLLPPTRAVVWQLVKRVVISRLTFGPRVATWGYQQTRRGPRGGPPPGDRPPPGSGPPPRGPRAGAGPRPGDIEGTAEELRDSNGHLPAGEPKLEE
jgi:UPF0716 protein FxsA